MKVDLRERIGKKVVGFREETGEKACAEGGKIRLMEDEFMPFCRNMVKMEMEEWVRQRKAFVGEMVAKDVGSGIVQGKIMSFHCKEEGKGREKDEYGVKYETWPRGRKGGKLTMNREPKMKYLEYNEMLKGRDLYAEVNGIAQS